MNSLIAGGTGKTGSRVARILTGSGHPHRVASRHGSPPFDWHDRTTWDAALGGCTAAYLAFQPDLGLPGADEIVAAFAQEAVAHGCRRLVLLSGRGEEGARRAEIALIESGADWTILRSAFFMQNFTESFSADEIAHGSLTMVEGSAALLVAAGLPAYDASGLAHLFHEVLDGRNAHVDHGVRSVLGREPHDFDGFLVAALTPGAPRG